MCIGDQDVDLHKGLDEKMIYSSECLGKECVGRRKQQGGTHEGVSRDDSSRGGYCVRQKDEETVKGEMLEAGVIPSCGWEQLHCHIETMRSYNYVWRLCGTKRDQ